MAKRKTITGACITWRELLGFLGTLRPWQELSEYVSSRCGSLNDATRRLMAVAVGHCAHNYDFPRNLRRLLKMINDGNAAHFRWHGHVSPKRWSAINTVIVAVQGWLQEKSPVTLSREFGVKQRDLRILMGCLGREHSHIKRAMLRRLLWNLIDNAVHNTGIGVIGDCDKVPAKELRYLDFSAAYHLNGEGDYSDYLASDQPIRELDDEIRSFGKSGEGFVTYIRIPMGPFCQQKMLRHQQVVLYRIAHKWTDPSALPPGGIERSEYETLFSTYADAISRWYEDLGAPVSTKRREIYEEVFKLLGKRTACKQGVIDCLVFRSKPAQDLQEAAFHWLREHALKSGK